MSASLKATRTTSHPLISLSTGIYQFLLAAYPRHFQVEYGPHMTQVFRDCCREAYGRSRVLGLFWMWLSALADLTATALEERLAPYGGPRNVLYKIGAGLAAGMIGGAFAGLGARLAMRGVALAGGLPTNFSLEGTFVIVAVCMIMGTPFGALYTVLYNLIPGRGIWKGLTYGILLFVIFLAPPFLFYREGEALLATPLITVSLFGPIALLYGLVVQFTLARLTPEPQSGSMPRSLLSIALIQIVRFALFTVLLELGVLGLTSIIRYTPSLPPGIVFAAQDFSIPFGYVRDGNRWLIGLVGLGYFGLSALLFWRPAAGWMARSTAVALLFFGGAFFNTGVEYYDDILSNSAALQPYLHFLQVMAFTGLLVVLCLFPDGRFASRWTPILMVAWAIWALVWLGQPDISYWVVIAAIAAFLAAGCLTQWQRYRQAESAERDRLRLPAWGFTAAILGFAICNLLIFVRPDLSLPRVTGPSTSATFSLYMLPWLFVPLSIGWAIRRHNLWTT